MGRPAASRAAWCACGAILLLIVCTAGLATTNSFDLERASFLFAEASAALVGGFIASRHPRNPVGWIVLGHAFCFSLGEFCRQYAIYGVQTAPGSLPVAGFAIWPTYWVWFPGLCLMFFLLPLYFPDGLPPSPRWRWVAHIAVAFSLGATLVGMFRPGDDEAPGIPNPLGIELSSGGADLFAPFAALVHVGLLVFGAAGAASLVARFRRSAGEGRQQIKWVVLATVVLVVYTAASRLFFGFIPPLVDEVLFVLSLEGMWLAIAVAILRYRLYDIDVIINRTLVYTALTGTLLAVYAGSVVLLQQALRLLGGGESQLAIVSSTLVIAALFGPLRRGIQSFIDRRFYRTKYDARRTLDAFSAKLRDGMDLDALNDELVSAVRATMRPVHASVWLREPATRDGVASAGRGRGMDSGPPVPGDDPGILGGP